MRLTFWQIEALFVAAVLSSAAALTYGDYRKWLCASAIQFTFLHLQLVIHYSRHNTHDPERTNKFRKLTWRYHLMQQVLWASYFWTSKQWTALLSVALLGFYPTWFQWRSRTK